MGHECRLVEDAVAKVNELFPTSTKQNPASYIFDMQDAIIVGQFRGNLQKIMDLAAPEGSMERYQFMDILSPVFQGGLTMKSLSGPFGFAVGLKRALRNNHGRFND